MVRGAPEGHPGATAAEGTPRDVGETGGREEDGGKMWEKYGGGRKTEVTCGINRRQRGR